MSDTLRVEIIPNREYLETIAKLLTKAAELGSPELLKALSASLKIDKISVNIAQYGSAQGMNAVAIKNPTKENVEKIVKGLIRNKVLTLELK
jgi:hypothetical protein